MGEADGHQLSTVCEVAVATATAIIHIGNRCPWLSFLAGLTKPKMFNQLHETHTVESWQVSNVIQVHVSGTLMSQGGQCQKTH